MDAKKELISALPALLWGHRKPGQPVSYAFFHSGIFRLLLFSGDSGLFRIIFIRLSDLKSVNREVLGFVEKGVLREGGASLVFPVKELQDYFSGNLTDFSMKLDIEGTDFKKKVLKQLMKIPYGETLCYSDVAREAGSPRAARAVGRVCNKNPLPIVIPCHRVVGITGALTGYAPGINYKKKMLLIERKKR